MIIGNKDSPIEEVARLWFESVIEFLANKEDTKKFTELQFFNKNDAILKNVDDYFEEFIKNEMLRSSGTRV